MKRQYLGYSFVAALMLLISSISLNCFAGETGVVSPSQKTSAVAHVSKPESGQTKDQVVQKYGMPLSKAAEIGSPPISKWHYPTYTVYFEFNRVIHTVSEPK
ncbi:MAG: hypothetical protein KUG80_07495 [Gammaproteobacteria bacterium]|nr:hypothetical protein [Gammaproteobacteria bacterium]